MQISQTLQKIADRVNNLSPSQTIAMAQNARALAEKGVDVINLSLGEPDFQTPEHIKEAAKKAIDEGYTFYSPVPGYMDLRKAIAQKLSTENKIACKAENIVVSTGAKQTLANIFLSLLDKGDEVIILAPYWVTYKELVKLAEGVPVIIEGTIENDFKTTPEQIKAAITDKTKAILYSSPSNPTGSVFSEQELRSIAEILLPHEQIMVVADEIYEHIVFEENYFSMASIEVISGRVVTVNGFSKGFAMTGWRLGYMAAPTWLAKACEKIQGQVTSGTCSIAQRAALTAITTDLAPTFKMREAYLKRRNLVLKWAKDIKGFKTTTPKGAFYLFPDISDYFGKAAGEIHINSANDLSMYLLNEGHVSTVPGEAFGSPQNIRISFASSEKALEEAFKRMKKALDKLK